MCRTVSRNSPVRPELGVTDNFSGPLHAVSLNGDTPSTPFRDFTKWCGAGRTDAVEIQDHRRQRLRQWIKDQHDGNVSAFAATVKKSQPQIADMLDGRKSFGEKVARSIEELAMMPPAWLDQGFGVKRPRTDSIHEPMISLHNFSVTVEAARLAVEWDKLAALDRAYQIQVQAEIETRVASLMKGARKKTRSSAKGSTEG